MSYTSYSLNNSRNITINTNINFSLITFINNIINNNKENILVIEDLKNLINILYTLELRKGFNKYLLGIYILRFFLFSN